MSKEIADIFSNLIKQKECKYNQLQKEQKILSDEINEINSEIEKIRKTLSKREGYDPDSGFCPYCFSTDATSIEIKPIMSDDNIDHFICPKCKNRF